MYAFYPQWDRFVAGFYCSTSSGESGAGKTVNTKHYGNAKTVRNANSSHFVL